MDNVELDIFIIDETRLSAGICDNCKVPKIIKCGDGITEPFTNELLCEYKKILIEPQSLNNQIKHCEGFIDAT